MKPNAKPKRKTDRQRVAALERTVRDLLIQVGINHRLIIYLQEDAERKAEAERELLP